MLPRLWGSDVSTIPANSRHVVPWTVVAESNPPLGLDVQIAGLLEGRANMTTGATRRAGAGLRLEPGPSESPGPGGRWPARRLPRANG
jgi:hypothetical protein